MKAILSWGMFAVLCAVAAGGFIAIYQQDMKDGAYREILPSMVRTGVVEVNNTTLHLWAFDFEGKRCLWATEPVGRGGRGGLTCWEDK